VKVSDRAEVSRSFNVKDLEEYSALSGHVVNTEYVPEPLIGALFSYLLGVKVPGDGTMYLKQETRYLDEARLGETLHASAEITRLRPEKSLVDLATTCHGQDGRIIAEGRALVYVGDIRQHLVRND
jgi:acyl dehydratase